jgi:membrane associated rhomboid family serine protease
MSSGEPAILVAELFLRVQILAQMIAIAWTVWLTDVVFLGKALSHHLGIRPRTLGGLLGVGFAPLLHGSIDHLTGNTVPFFILGGLILLKGVDNFVIVTATTMLSSGLGKWLFGESKVNSIGASGVIFGYLGFLLLRGYYDHEVVAALASLIVCFFYSYDLWGIFPMPEQEQRLGIKIGWDAHLFGLLGGAATARFLEAIKLALPEGLLS